jgi:hypothetical protein
MAQSSASSSATRPESSWTISIAMQRPCARFAASVSPAWRAAKDMMASSRTGDVVASAGILSVNCRDASVQSSHRPRCSA